MLSADGRGTTVDHYLYAVDGVGENLHFTRETARGFHSSTARRGSAPELNLTP